SGECATTCRQKNPSRSSVGESRASFLNARGAPPPLAAARSLEASLLAAAAGALTARGAPPPLTAARSLEDSLLAAAAGALTARSLEDSLLTAAAGALTARSIEDSILPAADRARGTILLTSEWSSNQSTLGSSRWDADAQDT